MARFPLSYEVTVDAGDGSPFAIHAEDRPVIGSGPPPDFGGDDRAWSPEHLFVSAVASCYLATFFALAKRASLSVDRFACRAKGTLERTGFTAVELAVDATVAGGDVERTQKLLADAKAHCFVANSIKCPVNLALEVRER